MAPPRKTSTPGPAAKKMRIGNVTEMTVESRGVRVETVRCNWKIKNFDIVRQSDELISGQKLDFEVSSGVGMTKTKCAFYLLPKDDWLGCYFKVVEYPRESLKEVNVSFSIQISKPNNGGLYVRRTLGYKPIKNLAGCRSWGFEKIINRKVNSNVLPLVDGALTIQFEFNLYTCDKRKPGKTADDAEVLSRSLQKRKLGLVHAASGRKRKMS